MKRAALSPLPTFENISCFRSSAASLFGLFPRRKGIKKPPVPIEKGGRKGQGSDKIQESGKNPGDKSRFLRKTGQQLAYAPNRKSRLFPGENPAPKLICLARGASFQELGLILRPASRAAKKDDRPAGKTAVQPALTFQFLEGNKRATGNRPFEKFLFSTDIHKKGAAIAEERHGLLRGQCFQHQKNRLLKSGATNGTQTKRASRKGAARTSAIPLPTAEGPPLFPASPPKHTPRNGASEPDAPPSLISGVRQTASALWTAGPSARFPAVFPADFCR